MWHLLCLHASLKLISLSTDCPTVLQNDAIKKKNGSVLGHVTLEGLAVLRTAEDTDKQFSLLTRASATRKTVSQTQLSIYIRLGSGIQSDALSDP